MIRIARPNKTEYPEYFGNYISKVTGDDLFENFKSIHEQFLQLIKNLSEEKLNYRYAAGKWTIKEIIGHLIDTERVMSYRAIRFARYDTTPLSGFEENDWANASNASLRSRDDLLNEFHFVRESTLALFKSFDEKMLSAKGMANNKEITVRALAYMIPGHEMHHLIVIRERYL